MTGLHATRAPVGDRHRAQVCAIVVTRNRRELLATCLERLLAQTRPLDRLVVVDNAGSDGSAAMVRERFASVELLRLEENVGGAGGFHAGMRAVAGDGHEWLWLMDDDTFAEPTALEALLAGDARAPEGVRPMMLASQVRWKDGSLHPMNEPWPRWRWPAAMALGVRRRLLLIRHATFVSLLVRGDAVQRFGLPLAHYFIWTDDFEYTGRVLREHHGYLVPDSVVVHFTPEPHSPGAASGERFYYFVRNSLLLLRGSSLLAVERLQYLRLVRRLTREYVAANWRDPRARSAVARGLRDGLRRPVR